MNTSLLWVGVDNFGLPKSFVSLSKFVAMMIKPVSLRESPKETMYAHFAGSLSMSYNWLSTLVLTNVRRHVRIVTVRIVSTLNLAV